MHWVLEANLPILSVSNGLTSDVNVEFWVLGTIYYYEFIMNLIARLCHFARKFILKVKNYSHITKTSPLHKRNGVKFLFLVEKHQELLGEFFLPLQHRTWTNAYKGTVLSNFFKTCLNLSTSVQFREWCCFSNGAFPNVLFGVQRRNCQKHWF